MGISTGHRVIARIAERNLNPKAREVVEALPSKRSSRNVSAFSNLED
jgi:hypothetical protein